MADHTDTPETRPVLRLRLTGAQLDEMAAMWPESGASAFGWIDYDEYELFAPVEGSDPEPQEPPRG